MDIRYDVATGWQGRAALRQRIGAYARIDRVRSFKVGITCNPKGRAALYRCTDKYDEMVVLYQTSSDAVVRILEYDLTDWFWDDCDNINRGGAGPSGQPPYYLYVVLEL